MSRPPLCLLVFKVYCSERLQSGGSVALRPPGSGSEYGPQFSDEIACRTVAKLLVPVHLLSATMLKALAYVLMVTDKNKGKYAGSDGENEGLENAFKYLHVTMLSPADEWAVEHFVNKKENKIHWWVVFLTLLTTGVSPSGKENNHLAKLQRHGANGCGRQQSTHVAASQQPREHHTESSKGLRDLTRMKNMWPLSGFVNEILYVN